MAKTLKTLIKPLAITLMLGLQNVSYGQTCSADGGVISTTDNTIFCVGDSNDDIVSFKLEGSTGTKSIWLVTDEDRKIQSRLLGQPLNFNEASDGVSLVYHLSYEEDATGFGIGNNITDITGCADFSNPISIVKNLVEGGVIFDNLNVDARTACIGVQEASSFSLNVIDQIGDNFSWVITNNIGEILDVQSNKDFDLKNYPEGICFIYHIGYDELINLEKEKNISDLEGCYDLSNPYTVTKLNAVTKGGNISTSSNLFTCSGDGVDDFITVTLENHGPGDNLFILSDFKGNILSLTSNIQINTEGISNPITFINNINFSTGIEGLTIGRKIEDLQGCFDLSNAISVTHTVVKGGNLSDLSGNVKFSFCTDDGQSDIVALIISNNESELFRLIEVDDKGEILSFPASSSIDFEGSSPGTSIIYNVAYQSDLQDFEIGNNLSDLQGCYSLSNAVEINRSTGETNGGIITTSDPTFLCAGDDISDIVNITITGQGNKNGLWVISDEQGLILDLQENAVFDFSNASSGICKIYFIDYASGIINLEKGKNLIELQGCFDLSNSITINRNGVNGGNIQYSNRTTERVVCVAQSSTVTLPIQKENNIGANEQFLLTDTSGMIRGIFDNNTFDFSDLPIEEYYIYNLSNEDNLNGLTEGSNIDAFSGCFDLSNNIKVELINSLTTPSALTTESPTIICVGDGEVDQLNFKLTPGVGNKTTWVVTDFVGNILHASSNQNSIDFEALPERLNFLSVYKHDISTLNLEKGKNIVEIEGCFSVSNIITITKNLIDPGHLSILENGTNSIFACIGDASKSTFTAKIEGNSGENSIFLITTTGGTIEVVTSSNTFDFSTYDAGTSLIWHASYVNGAEGLEAGKNVNQLNGCVSLSNPLTITRETIKGGKIKTTDDKTEVFICGGEGVNDLVEVTLQEVEGFNRSWVLLDINGEILDLPTGPVFSFENAPTGICYLSNMSYGTGLANLSKGNNLSDLDGCFDLSNQITVNRTLAEGGDIELTTGGTSFESCVKNNEADVLTFQLSNNSGTKSDFILVNRDNRIIKIFNTTLLDVNTLSGGRCKIYHVGYFEDIGLTTGIRISELDGCFDLSNAITVNKIETKGGVLSDSELATELNLCVGDGVTEMINVRLSGAIGNNIGFIITDNNGKILTTNAFPPFNLEQNVEPINKIYSIAYEDGIIGKSAGRNILDIEGCFSLSNPIVVNKDIVQSSSLLTTQSGKTATTMCLDDGIPNILILKSEGDILGKNTHLVITDDDGIIEDPVAIGSVDFSTYGDGISNVYQLSYADGLDGLQEGKNIADLNGCFSISNKVNITRVTKGSCIVSTIEIDGKAITLSLNPNPANDYLFLTTSENINERFSYEIYDNSGKLLAAQKSANFRSGSTRISISDFNSGLYYLKVYTENQVTGLKFIKL